MAELKETTHIIVDCQLLQTKDRDRGMGLFLYSLLTAISLEKPDVSWTFLLNQNKPKLSKKDKQLLEDFNGDVIVLDLLSKQDKASFGDALSINRSKVDKTLEPLLQNQDKKPVFFIPALFSDEIYPVFPSDGTKNLMLFHDIIPYLYHKHYFRDLNGLAFKDYAERFTEFYKTDLFVTNSQTTADDLIIYFGVDPVRVKAILGAGASRKGIKPRAPEVAGRIDGGYLLMPSGDDYRKNNLTAAHALAKLNSDIKLVVTSNFGRESQNKLTEIYPNTIFVGSIDDDEYLWLVDNSRAVLFPTEYEGLGMPLLEAVDRGVTAVCSNIPVFVEISPDAFFFFDPKSATDLTRVIEEILDPKSAKLIADKKRNYGAIMRRFTWENTAKSFIDVSIRLDYSAPPKKKLAVLCPAPDSYSAIGKYIFELHAELSRLFEVTYFVEEGSTQFDPSRPNILRHSTNYYKSSEFNAASADEFDFVVYNIGNSEFHTDTILSSLSYPANTVVHDTKLKGVFDFMLNRKIITQERYQYELYLDRVFSSKLTSCLISIVANQEAAFCHSDYAVGGIKETLSTRPPAISKLFLPTGVPVIELPRNGVPIVSFAGIITENKGINLVSEISELENLRVKVFGFGVLGNSPLLSDLSSNVEVIKDLSDKDFQDTLRSSSILINYRLNYNGETSLSTLEAMRFGTVVIVNKVGWYNELPDDSVVKVTSEADALEKVKQLISEPDMRKTIGKKACNYVAQHHSHGEYARALSERIR